jgi:chromosome segregation ATPase
MDRVQNERRM